jgi:hypothetical protein
MKPAPKEIGGARVVLSTPIDAQHQPTGNCKQIVAGVLQRPAAGLAICQYTAQDGFSLFACDADWENISDTWHETLEEAMDQAEFEYEGVSQTWQRHA